MQMLVPDFWKGRGRFSKQAICRKVKDAASYDPLSDVCPQDEGSDRITGDYREA